MPEQTGSGLATGPVTESGSPHEFTGLGGVGTTCVAAMQATVDPEMAGKVNDGGVMV
jgi:hypothetical protein